MQHIEATLTQCRQLAAKYDLRDTLEAMDDQPDWITCNQSLGIADIHAIQRGGCESGAYMPAVTYYTARETMNEHGDEVLDYLTDHLGQIPVIPSDESWSGIAVFFLSYAVEVWASQFDLDGVDWD